MNLVMMAMMGTAPEPVGQIVFESGATLSTTWTVPPYVRKVSLCAAGQGGNRGTTGTSNGSATYGPGGGCALSYANDVPVTPGEQLIVQINATETVLKRGTVNLVHANAGRPSSSSVKYGRGGAASTVPGGQVSYAGGDSGQSSGTMPSNALGGGGAAGYAGEGGEGAAGRYFNSGGSPGTDGKGGGGGGGGVGGNVFGSSTLSASGGGVGLKGQGANGAAGGLNTQSYGNAVGGGGGSGGSDATDAPVGGGTTSVPGKYGGGASAATVTGGMGGLRIMWGGGRSYPSNAEDIE